MTIETDPPLPAEPSDAARRARNLAAVESAFRGVSNGDAAEQMQQYTADLVMEMPYTSPPKRVEGKPAVLEYLTNAFVVFQMQLSITEVHPCVDPDELVVEFVSHGLVMTTGKSYSNQYINLFRFRDGSICFQREFFNPNAVASALVSDEAEAPAPEPAPAFAADLRSVTECTIPHPMLEPVTDFAPERAERIAQSGMATFYGQFEHAPGLIDKWFAFYQPVVTDDSTLALRTKELCRLRIAARNGCMFCLGGRFRDAAGTPVVDDDDVDAVLGGRLDDERFTASESAAMRFTEVFRLDHMAVDKQLVDETLRHLTTAQFIELGLCIAQFTGMGQLFAMLGLPSM